MPSDFDFNSEEEALADLAQKEAAAEAERQKPKPAPERPVPAAAPPPRPTNVNPEREMDEIELKMAKAQYYWELLGLQLFDSPDDLAVEVEEEVHAFVKGKLAELMGGGAKRRGRKPAQRPGGAVAERTMRLSSRPARPATRPAPVARQPVGRLTTARGPVVPETSSDDIISIIEAPDGTKKEKIYRKAVDPESGKVYYRGYDKVTTDGVSELVGDGNKYEMAVNVHGGQYFRVISQQSLPVGVKHSTPSTPQQISAASEEHARVTMAAIRKNPLLAAIVDLSQK